MFELFKSDEQKAIDKFWRSEMGKRLASHNEKYFGPGAVWDKFTPESKGKFTGWLVERIFTVYQAADPFAATRLELAAMVYAHAELTVLNQEPLTQPSRFVSGELYKHIRACTPHCNELAEELWRNPQSSDKELYQYARQRSVYFNYMLNGINLLRYEFDDFAGGAGRDWMRPFSRSMMIWKEDTYRSKIGLPTLLDDEILRALPHSTFFEIVRSGARNPLFEWENDYGSHEAAST